MRQRRVHSRPRTNRLAQSPANDIEDLFDVSIGVALLSCVTNATLDVVFEDEKSHGVHRRTQSRSLLEDIDAVFPALDHALDSADLAGDTTQPPNQNRLIA
jgi:hypothetical protein